MSTSNQTSGLGHIGVLTITGGEDSAFVTPQLVLTEVGAKLKTVDLLVS